jgi:hypothetical protein
LAGTSAKKSNEFSVFPVMAGHSRLKDGVLSPAYVPAIHVFDFARLRSETWMPGIKPGMTGLAAGRD